MTRTVGIAEPEGIAINLRVFSQASGRPLPISLYDAGYQQVREDERCKWPFHQIVCCYQGEGRMTVEGRPHPLHPGTALLLPPNAEHVYHAASAPYYVSWVSFHGPLAQSLPAYYGLAEPLRPVVLSDPYHPDLHLQLISVMEIADLSDSAERISVLLYGIYTEFLLRCDNGESGDVIDGGPRRKVDDVVRWMRDHLQQPADIGELARTFQISRQHLNRMFRSRYGTTTKEFFLKLKILQAKKDLLHFPDTDIRRIAAGLGFPSASHFARVFRQAAGVSPSHFRNADSARRNWQAEQTENGGKSPFGVESST